MRFIMFAAAAAFAAMMGGASDAATYNYSFSNEDGAIGGTVSGAITLGDGDGLFAATSVKVTSAPLSLGYTLPVEILSPSYSNVIANSITVLGG